MAVIGGIGPATFLPPIQPSAAGGLQAWPPPASDGPAATLQLSPVAQARLDELRGSMPSGTLTTTQSK